MSANTARRGTRWLAASCHMGTAEPLVESMTPAPSSFRVVKQIRTLLGGLWRSHIHSPRIAPSTPTPKLPKKTSFRAEAGKLLPATEVLLSYARSLDARARLLRYPSLSRFAADIGLSEEILIATYELEDCFHDRMLSEPSREIRRELNGEAYKKIFDLYGTTFAINIEEKSNMKDQLVALLRPELEGNSILDVGCGAGAFLLSCTRNIAHRNLLGLDLFADHLHIPEHHLTFRRSDIVRFAVSELFDVAITDNVYEHISPLDVSDHLSSIRAALRPGGTIIVLTPHRAFGPWDVTRIVDDSYSGTVPARGTHLNETTYTELASRLAEHGFTDFRTIHPKARLGLRVKRARVPIGTFCRGERNPVLIKVFQAMDKRYRYQAFEISMIGTRR